MGVVVVTKDEARKQGWLCREDMIASSGLTESAFDRLGLDPVARSGRYAFYTGRQLVVALLAKEYHKRAPWLCRAALHAQAEEYLR